MIENDRFTSEHRDAVQIFIARGCEFLNLAEEADNFLRKRTPNEIVLLDPQIPVSEGISNIVLNESMFLRRFFEVHFNEKLSNQIKREAQAFAGDFYIWQEKTSNEFSSRNTRESEIAAEIINTLTIQKAFLFAAKESGKYRAKGLSAKKGSSLRIDLMKQSAKWRKYSQIAGRTIFIDRP
jgi:hypothetical protein